MAISDIKYLKSAESDLVGIFNYIKKDNPDSATALYNRINQCISLLRENPHMGKVPNDKRLEQRNYRILIVDFYLVFYVIKGNTITIKRIIHSARQYNFLLK